MGGPSAAIIVEELVVARCAPASFASGPAARLSTRCASATLVRRRVAPSGPTARARSSALAGDATADPALLAALEAAAGPDVARGTVASTDLFYDPVDRSDDWLAIGAIAVEMECAAVFAVAARRGVAAAAVLLVTRPARRRRPRIRICDEALHAAELELGRVAIAALT